MATNAELIAANAELKAQVAGLTERLASATTGSIEAQVARAAAWVEGAGLQVVFDQPEPDVLGEFLLCTVDGLPADGYVVDGKFTTELPHHDDDDGMDATTPVALWNYEEGTGFVHVQEGTTVPLERWRVRESDGTFTDPKAGELYRYDGSHDLVKVAVGDESAAALKVEMLQMDVAGLTTRLDEEREKSAALQRRLDHSASLHGLIDDLPGVV